MATGRPLRNFGLRYFLPVLAVWLVFSWPLPRYLFSGIPSSAHRAGRFQVRNMIAGDHLQVMYHFWLAADMIAGKTPLFHNVYEFNTGQDVDRVERGSYFMPFPLFYGAGALLGGRAFGWNLAGFLSLLLTYIPMRILLRRYIRDEWIAGFTALAALVLPYRWTSLLGGSPTGFAMMWVPVLLLGIDMVVRDDRLAGGALAGAAILFSCWGDTHVFFFSVLIVPGWCLVTLLAREKFEWKKLRAYGRMIRAFVPALVFLAVAVVYVNLIGRELAGSHAAQGRGLNEVANFAPRPAGLFGWQLTGVSGHAYLGWITVAVIVVGWACLAFRCLGDFAGHWRKGALLTVLCLGLVGVVWLALGPHGPFGGRLLLICRKLIPPYAMVRQTGKIYCLVPPMLAVATALALSAVFRPAKSNWGKVTAAAICLLIIVEYRFQIDPTICLVQVEQLAYRAAAEDSRSAGKEPRAIVAALWPGDSHWSSLYQHFASLYRIRMLNGYRPFVPADYFENVFSRFDSVNMGELTDDQLDDLLNRGIQYVLLHEDAFPEKVSSYPIAFTLKRLLNHPRLSLLKQDKRVWAFKILTAAEQRPELASAWKMFSPSRLWEMEKSPAGNVDPAHDETASGLGYVSVSRAGAFVETRLTSTVDAPGQRWMIRARGQGRIVCEVLVNGEVKQQAELDVDSPIWAWKELSLPRLNGYVTVLLRLNWQHGATDLDAVLLAAGEWQYLDEGEILVLPAPSFFRAGYTDLHRNTVILEKDSDPNEAIFYGPNMPMTPGEYEMNLEYSSPAAHGTVLGCLSARSGQTTFGPVDVVSGREARVDLALKHNLPLRADFVFARNADIEISNMTFKRLK